MTESISNSPLTIENKPGLLLVANWDSNVGYAWWLMESFWVEISKAFSRNYEIYLAYPSISKIPNSIACNKIKPTTEFHEQLTISKGFGRKFIKDKNIKAMYFTDWDYSSFKYFMFRLHGVDKIIVHDHTPGIRTKPNLLKSLIKKAIRNSKPFNPDYYFAVSEFVSKRLHESACINRSKIFTVRNGIFSELREQEDLKKKLNLDESCTLIASISRANKYKGIEFALQALSKLEADKNALNWHFVFIGDGPDLENFKLQAKSLGIESKVTFTGRMSNPERFLSSCDIALHTSKGEVGYSLSILESQKYGVPVVCTNNPSVCETISNHIDGLLFSENNVEECKNALINLITSKDLQSKLKINGPRKIIEQYNLSTTHKALISSFRKAIH